VFPGVGFATLRTAEALKAIAVLPELAAFAITGLAIHATTLQQAVAVVDLEVLTIGV